MKRHRQRASRETLAFLADHCEGNLLAARQEIEKLALLLPEGELAHDAVEARHRRRRALRRLPAVGSLAGRRRDARAAHPERRCRPKATRPIAAIWQLVEDVHAIAAVHTMVRDGHAAVASAIRNVRVWGKRQNALERAVNRVAPASVAAAAAVRSRSSMRCPRASGRGDAWDALTDVALTLCGKPTVRRGMNRRPCKGETMYRKILVAYDGSPESRLALDECIRLAPGPTTAIHLAGVVHDPSLYVLAGEYVPEIALGDDEARVDADIKEAAAQLDRAWAWPSRGTSWSGSR